MHDSSKSSIRQSGIRRRKSISPKDHAVMSAACCRELCVCIESLPSGTPPIIAGYSAIRGELDIGHALSALAEHHTLALPVASKTAKLLSFRRYHRGDSLVPGAFGVFEPLVDAEVLIPDILIVPLLAFDRSGHRLGYGAGYYDITLAHLRDLKRIIAIGAAFSLQEEASLPSEPHDERLDIIVTEKEIIIPVP